MAGVGLTIEYDDVALQRALGRLMDVADDLEPLWRDIGEYLLQSIDARFDAQVDPEGTPWAPLAPSTRRRKRGSKILTERGHLRDIAYQVHPDGLDVGTNMIYGAIQQLGGQAGGGVEIPARPYLGLSADDVDEIEALVADFVAGLAAP